MSSKIETLIHAPTYRLRAWLRKWESAIAAALLHGQYRITPEGVVLFEDRLLRGTYFDRIVQRMPEPEPHHNLIVDQGIMKALAVMFYTDAKIPDWYITLFNGSTPPTANLTAANFAATMGEVTSTTEGFTNATRPKFVPSSPVANVIGNLANKAVFHIAATSSVTVTGGALLSSDVRGGGSGVLWSAGLFNAPRELYDGEDYELGYQTSLVG